MAAACVRITSAADCWAQKETRHHSPKPFFLPPAPPFTHTTQTLRARTNPLTNSLTSPGPEFSRQPAAACSCQAAAGSPTHAAASPRYPPPAPSPLRPRQRRPVARRPPRAAAQISVRRKCNPNRRCGSRGRSKESRCGPHLAVHRLPDHREQQLRPARDRPIPADGPDALERVVELALLKIGRHHHPFGVPADLR